MKRMPQSSAQSLGWVYVIQMEGYPWLKIGYTMEDPRVRLNTMQCGTPLPLLLLRTHLCDKPRSIEWLIHRMLAACRYRGEGFAIDLAKADETIQAVISHADDPIFFMTPEEQARYAIWCHRCDMSQRIQSSANADVSTNAVSSEASAR
jgi:hypothetical protein